MGLYALANSLPRLSAIRPPRQTKTPDAQYLIMSGKKAINALVMDPVLAVDSHGKNYL